MKKLLLATSIIVASLAPAQVVHADDSISLRICEYVAVNDKTRLRSFLKSRKLKIRTVFDDIKCNGQNLLVFAAVSNALDTGELLLGKLPVKTIQENMAEIAKHSAHLEAKAKARIE